MRLEEIPGATRAKGRISNLTLSDFKFQRAETRFDGLPENPTWGVSAPAPPFWVSGFNKNQQIKEIKTPRKPAWMLGFGALGWRIVNLTKACMGKFSTHEKGRGVRRLPS